MRKIWVCTAILMLLICCKERPAGDLAVSDQEVEFKAEELPKRIAVNSKSAAIINGWVEYKAFDNSFNAVYNASNNEDLILAVEDLIEKQKLWEESTYPAEFDKAQIKSRQKVLKTYLLKLKSALDNRAEFTKHTVEMIEAYNALRQQFDVIMNSTLDPKLLLDEE